MRRLFAGGWIVVMDDAGTEHRDGWLLAEDGLVAAIDAQGTRPEVVIAGCEAHVCLLQTALGLLRQGRRVWVVSDACGSRRGADPAGH